MGTRLVSSVSLVKLLMPFAIFSMHVLSKACIHSLHKNCAEGFALIPTVHIERAIGYNVLFFNRYRKGKISNILMIVIVITSQLQRALLTTSEFGYVSGTHATEVMYISPGARTRFFKRAIDRTTDKCESVF